jgi:hypothetical protein
MPTVPGETPQSCVLSLGIAGEASHIGLRLDRGGSPVHLISHIQVGALNFRLIHYPRFFGLALGFGFVL